MSEKLITPDGREWIPQDLELPPPAEFTLYFGRDIARIRHDYDTWRFPSAREFFYREPTGAEGEQVWPWVRRFGLPQVPEQHPASRRASANPDVITKDRWNWCSESGLMSNPYWADWYVQNNFDPDKGKLVWAVHEAAQMYNGNPYPNIPSPLFGERSGVPNGMEMLGNGGNTVLILNKVSDDWVTILTGNPSAESYPGYYDDPVAVHAVANIIQERRECPECGGKVHVSKEHKPEFWQHCGECDWIERCWMIAPNPKGTVTHPWVYGGDYLYFRSDWLESYPETPLSLEASERLPVLATPSIHTTPVGYIEEMESFTIAGYYLRGPDTYGYLKGGAGIVPLELSFPNNGLGMRLPSQPTSWKMKTLPPSIEEPVIYL